MWDWCILILKHIIHKKTFVFKKSHILSDTKPKSEQLLSRIFKIKVDRVEIITQKLL